MSKSIALCFFILATSRTFAAENKKGNERETCNLARELSRRFSDKKFDPTDKEILSYAVAIHGALNRMPEICLEGEKLEKSISSAELIYQFIEKTPAIANDAAFRERIFSFSRLSEADEETLKKPWDEVRHIYEEFCERGLFTLKGIEVCYKHIYFLTSAAQYDRASWLSLKALKWMKLLADPNHKDTKPWLARYLAAAAISSGRHVRLVPEKHANREKFIKTYAEIKEFIDALSIKWGVTAFSMDGRFKEKSWKDLWAEAERNVSPAVEDGRPITLSFLMGAYSECVLNGLDSSAYGCRDIAILSQQEKFFIVEKMSQSKNYERYLGIMNLMNFEFRQDVEFNISAKELGYVRGNLFYLITPPEDKESRLRVYDLLQPKNNEPGELILDVKFEGFIHSAFYEPAIKKLIINRIANSEAFGIQEDFMGLEGEVYDVEGSKLKPLKWSKEPRALLFTIDGKEIVELHSIYSDNSFTYNFQSTNAHARFVKLDTKQTSREMKLENIYARKLGEYLRYATADDGIVVFSRTNTGSARVMKSEDEAGGHRFLEYATDRNIQMSLLKKKYIYRFEDYAHPPGVSDLYFKGFDDIVFDEKKKLPFERPVYEEQKDAREYPRQLIFADDASGVLVPSWVRNKIYSKDKVDNYFFHASVLQMVGNHTWKVGTIRTKDATDVSRFDIPDAAFLVSNAESGVRGMRAGYIHQEETGQEKFPRSFRVFSLEKFGKNFLPETFISDAM